MNLKHKKNCGARVKVPPSPPSVGMKESKDAKHASDSGNGKDDGRTPAFRCPICMESEEDLSSVPCGHVFCTPYVDLSPCLLALQWSTDNFWGPRCIKSLLSSDERCPVCRAPALEGDLRKIFFH